MSLSISLNLPWRWNDILISSNSRSTLGFLCTDCWRRLSYLFLLFFGTLHSDAYIFPFLLCFSLLFFSQLSLTQNHYLEGLDSAWFIDIAFFRPKRDCFIGKEVWKWVYKHGIHCSYYKPEHSEANSLIKRWNSLLMV